MTTERGTEMSTAETQPETRTVTYRVFRLNPDRTDQTWNEMPPLTREDVPYWYPSAQDFGEAYGEGEFMYFEVGVSYAWVKFIEVASRRDYYEVETDEDE